MSIVPLSPAYAQGLLNLPQAGMRVMLSPAFQPTIISGITINPEDPLQLDFILDVGEEDYRGEELREVSQKLVQYFLAALTIPEDELWVNLSPYEKDRIVNEDLGHTLMGRDMLAQDYLLKQLTASIMYPEDKLGRIFWDRVYGRAYELLGTTNVPTNLFHRIWIVPEKAVIYMHGTSVFVLESRLKVMMEEDYLALEHHANINTPGADNKQFIDEAQRIFKEVLLPEIEKEVNEGKNFAPIRQMYHSMILATWYKNNLQQSILGQAYADQSKTAGVELENRGIKYEIYDQYVKAFKKGVYNYIREDLDLATQQLVPRKYFSGGADFESVTETTVDPGGDGTMDQLVVSVANNGRGRVTLPVRLTVVRTGEPLAGDGATREQDIGGGSVNATGVVATTSDGGPINEVDVAATSITERPISGAEVVSTPPAVSKAAESTITVATLANRTRKLQTFGQNLLFDISAGRRYSGKGPNTLQIVLGNESSDIDSITSSIAYAHAMNLAQGQDLKVLYVPLINTSKEEFRLKFSAVKWLQRFGITEDDLLFTDNFAYRRLKNARNDRESIQFRGYDVGVTLMDHNNLALEQSWLWPYVTEIFDHRLDEQEWPSQESLSSDSVLIEKSFGSNTSLVAMAIADALPQIPRELAHFLLGAIIKDNSNFKKDDSKYNPQELEIRDRLLSLVDVNTEELFALLMNKRNDFLALSLFDNLRHDYKIFEIGGEIVAIPRLREVTLAQLEAQGFLPEDIDDFVDYLVKKGKPKPTVIVGMLSNSETDGEDSTKKREVFFYSHRERLFSDISSLQTNPDASDFGFVSQNISYTDMFAYKSASVKRKKLLPFLRALLGHDGPKPPPEGDRLDVPMAVNESPGGIDFNANNLTMTSFGSEVSFEDLSFPLPDIDPGSVIGVTPVIINMTPVTNVPLLFGLNEPTNEQKLSML